MPLRELFANDVDYRIYANFSRLRDQVIAELRDAGIAPDVHAALDALAAGSGRAPQLYEPDPSGGWALTLCAEPHLMVRLSPLAPMPQSGTRVASLSEHTLLAVAAGGPVELRCYSLPADPGEVAVLTSVERLACGDARTFEAPYETFVLGEVDDDTLLISAVGARVSDVLRDYDPETLRHRRTTASSSRDSRLRFALLALSAFPPSERAIEAATALTAHEAHHVRWSAIDALASLSPGRARIALRAAVDDPNPHVRDAARRTLERIDVTAVAV